MVTVETLMFKGSRCESKVAGENILTINFLFKSLIVEIGIILIIPYMLVKETNLKMCTTLDNY